MRLIKIAWHLLAIVGLCTLVAIVLLARGGVSTWQPPAAMETTAARAARHLLIPSAERARSNPVPASPEHLRAGMEHWADHCATCHANDGSGDTPIGRNLYPRAPDMRLPETQQLSDGELLYIIDHGVKLTGMPAWSSPDADDETLGWQLVHFIRHLPSLTAEELMEMEDLNPRTPAEWRQREEERRFLSGESK